MAVDYVINHDCTVKGDLGGVQGFLQILKYAGHAKFLRAMMEDSPDITEDTAFSFMRIDNRGPHQQQEQLTVRQLEERGRAIDKYEDQCRQCPANVFGFAGGCSGAINYPISAQAEQWVLDRLPESLDGSVRGGLLKAFVKSFGRNGRLVDASRSRCCDLQKALVRTWGRGLFGSTKCTSSMILGNLYLVGEVQPLHGATVAYLLGAVDQPPTEDKRFDPQWVLNMNQLPDDGSIAQIASMLLALYRAYELDVTTFVDA
jgi:hypothetical protein